MQWVVLLGESGGCLLVRVVQLANRLDAMPGGDQGMAPARNAPVIAHGVVPVVYFVYPLACGQACASRNANRRGREGVGEARAASCKRIHVGRFDERVTSAGERLRVLLVREQNERVEALLRHDLKTIAVTIE